MAQNERPKSSKGGVRSGTSTNHHQSVNHGFPDKPNKQGVTTKPIDRVKSVDGKSHPKNAAPSTQIASKQKKEQIRSASSNHQAKFLKSSDKPAQRVSQITPSANVINSVDEASPMKNVASLDKKLISHLMPTTSKLAGSQSTSNIQPKSSSHQDQQAKDLA